MNTTAIGGIIRFAHQWLGTEKIDEKESGRKEINSISKITEKLGKIFKEQKTKEMENQEWKKATHPSPRQHQVLPPHHHATMRDIGVGVACVDTLHRAGSGASMVRYAFISSYILGLYTFCTEKYL